MSTIPYRNLFAGGAGILGAIGDGFQPGNSLEVRGDGTTVQIEVVNPDGVDLQIERARAGTNLWTLIDEPTNETERTLLTTWMPDFIYRFRQFSASTSGARVFVTNEIPTQVNNGSSGGFVPRADSIEPTVVNIYEDIPSPTTVSSGTLFLVVSDPDEILNGLHVARGTPVGQPALYIEKLKT